MAMVSVVEWGKECTRRLRLTREKKRLRRVVVLRFVFDVAVDVQCHDKRGGRPKRAELSVPILISDDR